MIGTVADERALRALHLPPVWGRLAGQRNLSKEIATEAVLYNPNNFERVSGLAYVPAYCRDGERLSSRIHRH